MFCTVNKSGENGTVRSSHILYLQLNLNNLTLWSWLKNRGNSLKWLYVHKLLDPLNKKKKKTDYIY